MAGMDPTTLILGLFAVACGLFLVAIWSGRWGIWVTGYLVVLLALAIALLITRGVAGPVDGPGDTLGASAQHRAGFGVVHPMGGTSTGRRI